MEAGGNFIGPRSLAQLNAYLGALDIELGEEHFDRLTRVSTIDLGIPHEGNSGALNCLAGGAAALVDGPAVPIV